MRLSSAAKRLTGLGLLTTTMLCTTGTAFAQDPPAPAQPAAQSEDDADIVVTAQRRAENLQDVPIAITAMGTETLEQLQVDEFNDYARLVPSLSFRSLGPGSANVYFRGVASGENANHSASLPSVGTYLDEQPITTITGALDLHIFDIAGSRRSPDRRARSTARRARPARSGSSPTGRTRAASTARPMSS